MLTIKRLKFVHNFHSSPIIVAHNKSLPMKLSSYNVPKLNNFNIFIIIRLKFLLLTFTT